MGLFFNEDINTLFVGSTEVSAVYLGSIKVWPVELPEEDEQIISMLFNELMLGNETLIINGETSQDIYETLQNSTMMTNETLLKNNSSYND